MYCGGNMVDECQIADPAEECFATFWGWNGEILATTTKVKTFGMISFEGIVFLWMILGVFGDEWYSNFVFFFATSLNDAFWA